MFAIVILMSALMLSGTLVLVAAFTPYPPTKLTTRVYESNAAMELRSAVQQQIFELRLNMAEKRIQRSLRGIKDYYAMRDAEGYFA